MTTLKLKLSVDLHKEEGEDYSSFAHEIGVASQGETPAEAEAYLQEAVELTLEDTSLSDLKYMVMEDDADLLDELDVPLARQAAIQKARQKIVQDIDKAMLAENQSLNGNRHSKAKTSLIYEYELVGKVTVKGKVGGMALTTQNAPA